VLPDGGRHSFDLLIGLNKCIVPDRKAKSYRVCVPLDRAHRERAMISVSGSQNVADNNRCSGFAFPSRISAAIAGIAAGTQSL
jgi:hypothetical protein